jgi:hypothetical protein
MALIQFSAVVGDARKKVGGVVFTKARSGATVRRKTSPIQPRTQAQTGVRANFTANSKDWSTTLTAAERAGWNALAARITVKNRFGAAVHLSGFQFYQRISRNLSTIGLAPITDAPANLPSTSPGTVTVAAVSAAHTLAVTETDDPGATFVPVIFATAPTSPGVTNIGKKYRYIFQAAAGTAGPYAAGADYVAKFGDWAVGQQIAIALVYIDNATGAAGTKVTATCVST